MEAGGDREKSLSWLKLTQSAGLSFGRRHPVPRRLPFAWGRRFCLRFFRGEGLPCTSRDTPRWKALRLRFIVLAEFDFNWIGEGMTTAK